jgi:hypothetical protein
MKKYGFNVASSSYDDDLKIPGPYFISLLVLFPGAKMFHIISQTFQSSFKTTPH